MNISKAVGYEVAHQKGLKLISLLRDIAILIGEQRQTWVTLENGGTTMPGLGLISEATHLLNCAAYIRQGVFKIIVLGTCKTGKSTLLNALLGEQIFPAHPYPTTGVVTHLVHGLQDEVMVYEEGKGQLYPVSWATFINSFVLSRADVSTLDAQGHIDSRLKNIRYVQLERDYPLLAHGVRLTDSPGVEVNINRPIVTPSFLKRTDTAIIVVLNAVRPLTKEVKTFLSTGLGSTRRENVFFVINRIDQLPEEMVEPLKRHVRQMLRQQFLKEDFAFDEQLYTHRVFYISAKRTLESRIASALETPIADIHALEKELENFLTSKERVAQALQPTLQTLDMIVDKARQHIAQKYAILLHRAKEGPNLALVKERGRLEAIEKKLLVLMDEASKVVFGQEHTLLQRKTLTGHLGVTEAVIEEMTGPLGSTRIDIDVVDHLHFVERAIERTSIPETARKEMRERINEVFYRCTDRHLYMAVVGEFSSGKSTFINALLREEILKASVLVTTMASTRIRYSASPNVEVRFKKHKELLNYREDAAHIWQLIRFFAHEEQQKSTDLRECIHYLTAVERAAVNVEHLVISHPAPFLSEGIVIIDTPGINSETPEHAQITQNLIDQDADAAVIIIPAPVSLQLTLRDFLMEHLQPFLHRCLFVVTQMDKIPEEEQEMLRASIRNRLSDTVGNRPFVVYESAPKIVLDKLNGRKRVLPEVEHWNNQFIELENTLWERLYHERTLSVAERLLRLLTGLFEQLDKYLRDQQTDQEEATLQDDLREIELRRVALQEKQKQLALVTL